MKTKYHQRRRTLLFSSALFVALLIALPGVYAEDQGADRPVVESKARNNIPRNEQPIESDTIRLNIPMVGPSGQEIHDFLYPTPEDGKVVTPAN